MGGHITPGPGARRTREEWLSFMREIVLEDGAYTTCYEPALRPLASAVAAAEIVMSVTRQYLPGDETAAGWVRCAIEEISYQAAELTGPWEDIDGMREEWRAATPERRAEIEQQVKAATAGLGTA